MYDSIVTRPATWADLPACLEVEHAAMKANHYLADVADLYFNGTVGDLTVAEVDGKIVGIGKPFCTMAPPGWRPCGSIPPTRATGWAKPSIAGTWRKQRN